ncbi:hypothetical protein GALL_468650 [mine drainage metagenome]|uniref:Uncharacterized protein n=1 Tax=mine drainage metagenome TaxID=410659 RepID=A0A1J5Q6E1_9ZZZZ
MRNTASELDNFKPTGDFAKCVGENLPVLCRNQGSDIALARIEQFAEGKENLSATGK